MYTGSLETVSNRQDWLLEGTLKDDSGALVDLTSALIKFEVMDANRCTVLAASTSNAKITITSLGVFDIAFTPNDMSKLCAGPYAVGCTIDLNDVTTQLVAGTVSVVDGVVR